MSFDHGSLSWEVNNSFENPFNLWTVSCKRREKNFVIRHWPGAMWIINNMTDHHSCMTLAKNNMKIKTNASQKMHFFQFSETRFFHVQLQNVNRWKSYEKQFSGEGKTARLVLFCLSYFSLLTRCDNWQMMDFSWRFAAEIYVRLCLWSNGNLSKAFHGQLQRYLTFKQSFNSHIRVGREKSSMVIKYSGPKFVII